MNTRSSLVKRFAPPLEQAFFDDVLETPRRKQGAAIRVRERLP
jgi:hypothetical protein